MGGWVVLNGWLGLNHDLLPGQQGYLRAISAAHGDNCLGTIQATLSLAPLGLFVLLILLRLLAGRGGSRVQ